MPLSDTERFGNFRTLKRAALGGTAEIWLAHGPGKEVVAVKVAHLPANMTWRSGQAAPAEIESPLRREARWLTARPTQAMCRLVDEGQQEGCDWIAMEWVEGVNLSAIIRSGALAMMHPKAATALGIEMADALAGLHDARLAGLAPHGLLHGHLAGQHIRVTPKGAVKLLDFSAAVPLSQGGRPARTVVPGPLHTSAPELLRGGSAHVGSEVYVLGLLLYELLTGCRAYEARDESALARLIVAGRTRVPSQHRHDLPSEIDRLCIYAIHPDPTRRLRSAADLAMRLRETASALGWDNGHDELRRALRGLAPSNRFGIPGFDRFSAPTVRPPSKNKSAPVPKPGALPPVSGIPEADDKKRAAG